jgi:hypothetical protein
MEDKQLTTEQSLAVITEMIERSKNNLRGNATVMIYYGWAMAAIALANFILLHLLTPDYLSFHVWWLAIPVVVGGIIMERRLDRSAIVRTQVDSFIGYVWRGYIIACFSFLAIILAIAFCSGHWNVMDLCTPVIMLMVGMGEYITGRTYRFRPFLIGAYLCWLGALLCVPAILWEAERWMFVIMACCMIAGFVIPGYALNRKFARHV